MAVHKDCYSAIDLNPTRRFTPEGDGRNDTHTGRARGETPTSVKCANTGLMQRSKLLSKDVQLRVNVQDPRFDPRCILAMLVRPDGVVAWAGESAPDYEESVQAASCWLGDPRGA
jgi:hypothetical protein